MSVLSNCVVQRVWKGLLLGLGRSQWREGELCNLSCRSSYFLGREILVKLFVIVVFFLDFMLQGKFQDRILWVFSFLIFSISLEIFSCGKVFDRFFLVDLR